MPEDPIYFDVTIQRPGVKPEKLIVAAETTRAGGVPTDQTFPIEKALEVVSHVLGRTVDQAEIVHLAPCWDSAPIETTADSSAIT